MSHNGVEVIDSDSTSSSPPTLAALYRSPIQKRRDGGQRYSVSGQCPIALSDDHRITWARDAGNAITPTS